MKNNLIKIFSLFLLIAATMTSCGEKNSPDQPSETERTILVYMVANNSLGDYGFQNRDFEEMEKAISTYGLNNCRWLVYVCDNGERPEWGDSRVCMFEYVKQGSKAVKKLLKTYDTSVNSATAGRLSQVIDDMKSLAPAKDYGLILWSHATGWATSLSRPITSSTPSITTFSAPKMQIADSEGAPLWRTCFEDRGVTMPINILAKTLPDNTFSFIYADACLMGSVEVAYQLRNKTRYFVASPTLLPSDGMPYDQNVPMFTKKGSADVVGAAKNTFNYYLNKSGSSQTCTMVVVDCSKLDALAVEAKKVMEYMADVDANNVQQLIYGYVDFGTNRIYDCFFYDLLDYVEKGCMVPSVVNSFKKALGEAVLYKDTTKSIFLQFDIDANRYCGLSTYILGTSGSVNETYYKTLDWYKDVYPNN